jgi:diguanylate cyclase (GGDEF)-like protein/PAS domain S-box-containing protein
VEVNFGCINLQGQRHFMGLARDISKQLQSEMILKYERDLNRKYLDTVQTLVLALDCAGCITMINRAGCELLGYAHDELLGRNMFTTCMPKSIATADLLATHHQLIAGTIKIVECNEYPVISKNGDEHLIAWHNAILNNELGEIIGILTSGEDITARKRAEDALRVAAVAFETHEAILITDATGEIISVNRAFTVTTGYSETDVLGKNPRIMSSGKHDKAFYVMMWQELLQVGVWAGEIWDRRKNGEIYPKWMTITAVKNEHHITIRYVAIFSDITQRKREEEEIRHWAFYDALTKLPNRRLLMDRIHQALAVSERTGKYGALMFLDMDNFKKLNDSKGHDVGDLLLIEVARRLNDCVRDVDTVARLGGDEFVVLLEKLGIDQAETEIAVEMVVNKIRHSLNQPYQLNEYEYGTTVSIGAHMFCSTQQSVEELLKYADQEMYKDKMLGYVSASG